MVTYKPYLASLVCALRALSRRAALLMLIGSIIGTCMWQKHSEAAWQTTSSNAPTLSTVINDAISFDGQATLPTILSAKDKGLYQAIFSAQKQGKWADADASIDHLNNKLLLGHVLAARYLDRHYKTNPNELAAWLDKYNDHPQAADIYAMAINKKPALKAELPKITKQPVLEGYGDDNGLAVRGNDSPYAETWRAGIQAWRLGHKEEAARLFSGIAKHQDELSPWMASASAYWSWRAYKAIGNTKEANSYLHLAALEPRSFYGILARKQLKQKLDLDTRPIILTDSDVLEMIGDQSIRRTVALAQAGFADMADRELRAIFPQADDKEKLRLLSLAHELGLASVQISMAKRLSRDGQELDFARYPIPNWKPEGGFRVAPELIYALMRQESGFRSSAVSYSGAMGLMQLMPQTALLMQKRMNSSTSANAAEPVLNVTLGQGYIEHLLNNELVQGNLVYLLTAYNAGPGRLQDWKQTIGHSDDPLLFVESIPYAQTRHYVMQVMTNYWIYSELSGNTDSTIYALLRGRWPSYDVSSIPADLSAARRDG